MRREIYLAVCRKGGSFITGKSLLRQGFDSIKGYEIYQVGKEEYIKQLLISLLLAAALAYFFYRSIWAFPFMCPFGIVYLCKSLREKQEVRKRELINQFKECILSVAASLKAGYAVENAFMESMSDMQMMFGEKAIICVELERIRRGLVLNATLEEMLWDLGKRSDAEEMKEFAEVVSIAKRGGGNISEIVAHSAEMIRQRVETEEELRILLASRRLEQKIMNIMPFGILLYIEAGNKGYFNGLYHNLTGVGIMTVCLILYLTAYWLAQRILKRIAKE